MNILLVLFQIPNIHISVSVAVTNFRRTVLPRLITFARRSFPGSTDIS